MKSCKDKSVLDLGSGSAILSAFAIKAGAKGVIAVDSAKVVDIMKAKRSEDELKAIKFINDTIENIALKNNKEEIIPNVDILVSEWMGYNLL
jgi:predicted nicotinamide N-methyase